MIAIAIFTGRDGNRMSAVYEERCLWMYARYEYKTLRLVDYSDEVLQASLNPFAAVMLVAKGALLRFKGTDQERDRLLYEQKMSVVRLLKERKAAFGEEKMKAIQYFLYNYLAFKIPENNRKFIKDSDKVLDKNITTMDIFEQMQEIKHQEGVEEGLEKAIRSVLTKSDFSTQEIAELLEVPVALVEKIKRELKSK